jgi:hypothetical protein
MEIEEKQHDKAKCRSWDIAMNNQCMNLNAEHCQLTVPECDSAMLSIAERTCP